MTMTTHTPAPQPPQLAVWYPRGVAILGAALGGLGLVMWIAAHWDTLGRTGHFALLQGLVLVMAAGAASKPDDGTNDSLRLQRRVHVQWSEPNQTRVRSRDLVQLSALPPDSKVAVNLGRISVATGVGGSATLRVPITNQSLTLVADDDATSGIVNFPFLADGTYTISRPGSAVDKTIILNASSRSQCWLTGGNVVSFDRTTCHG